MTATLPIEVQLAWETMTCRGMRATYDGSASPCSWFNEHYGPYPAFSFRTDPSPDAGPGERRTETSQCVGNRYNVPELMSGCRKAPIMTTGINPNLTAYQSNVRGATWCYPYFDDIGKYAHYFRFRTVNQERFNIDFVREYTLPGTKRRLKN